MRRVLCLFGLALVGLAFLAAPASADTACVAGNFSTIAGTTCDIGSLQFSFGSISGVNEIYDFSTYSYTYYATWGNSDFGFTPADHGFTLTFLGGPQSITAPQDGTADDFALLSYTVADLNLNEWIWGVSISHGVISASGNFGYFSGGFDVFGYHWSAVDFVSSVPNQSYSVQSPPQSYHSDSQDAFPFVLRPVRGGSGAWDGTPTTFTYSTSSVYIPTPIPEPSSVLMLSTGLVSLVALVRRKIREGRCLGS